MARSKLFTAEEILTVRTALAGDGVAEAVSVLPPKSSRSRNRSISRSARSARDPKKRGVSIPEIGVKILDRSWNGHRYAPAKIRVRKGCYRYLVWRDGLEKRELYLGKVKILAPRCDRGLAPATLPSSGAAARGLGVQK